MTVGLSAALTIGLLSLLVGVLTIDRGSGEPSADGPDSLLPFSVEILPGVVIVAVIRMVPSAYGLGAVVAISGAALLAGIAVAGNFAVCADLLDGDRRQPPPIV